MTDTKPPLPEPDTHCWDEDPGRDVWSYSEAQMRQYADAAVAAERSRLRQLVEAVRDANALSTLNSNAWHLGTEAQRLAWVRLMDALESRPWPRQEQRANDDATGE